jgi:adenine-specific DNA-methyltransferase
MSGKFIAMPTKFDEAFSKVQKLAAIFESGKDHYLSGDYQEADVRKDFIDKFFTAFGWDVNHDKQTNPYAQEVKVERGVNEGSTRKRADYAFFLKPNYRDVRFYVEAKRPSKDFGSADNYHQAIRYGWFTKRTSPFAVLTSFEDFHILDCRLKPNINDTLSRVVERFSYTDYVDSEKFARIYWLFSREAVAGGSLENFAESRPVSKAKRYQRGLFKGGDTQPDEDFLEELDIYRQQLARAFKDANPDLDGETLTEVTQRTLDRLVFTRFLEDKGIEAPVIENFGKADGFWEDFVATSFRLNRKYNGVVYKEHPKLAAPGFKPDEKVFARICEELTDPSSDYNFNVIPIHILGSIYERFLGKVISDGARVVEKPEVRKAGGVYYTPEYIVRYIVENTVGKMIEGKTPEEISKLKFADIACGSGSFLLGVYDVLLKYHAEYYSKNPGKVRKGDCVRRDGTLHLSLQKKRDILTNNLYGVDIDRQAVEVAQLSLYLKLLEDETVGTTTEFQDEFHFTLLPSLDKNIVCGNSLIGPDIADGGALTDEEEKKINPLDYAQRFPTIFRRKVSGGELRESDPGEIAHNFPGGMPLHGSYAKVSYTKPKKQKAAPPSVPESEYEGGFDAIVGNPPYGAVLSENETQHLRNRFQSAEYQIDTYPIFAERSHDLLKQGGYLGVIIPSAWVASEYNVKFRQFLCKSLQPVNIVIAPKDVFEDATVETVLLICRNGLKSSDEVKIDRWDVSPRKTYLLPFSRITNDSANIFPIYREPQVDKLIAKLAGTNGRFNQVSEAVWGVKVYQKGKGKPPQKGPESTSRCFHAESKTKNTHRKILGGSEVRRFDLEWNGGWVDYGIWLAEPRMPDWFQGERVLIREVTANGCIQASITSEPFVFSNSVDGLRLKPKAKVALKFLLALLNSRLLSFYNLHTSANAFKGAFPKVLIKDLLAFPLPSIENNKSRHDRLVELVEQMLAAKQKLPSAKTEGERDRLGNSVAFLHVGIKRTQ